ncbi:FAD-dependent oxidoreductase [Actinomycetospora lutea]|uniref:phytoene desaturase family protein n=1 Tax=Actinomycetospora lutea TaxID=663604 RepID=UPI002367336D|nr:FAD-dependent oxidoreductase [Actinomycetospora lutea]MDD7941359.1 FAD-dependent oxidoreductase [Actinomycetospora lutea]
MAKYDVVVIGAGAAGLTAASLLAVEGKSVCLLERSPYLGGRGMAVPDEGFTVNVGGHLIEDPGSGLTKVFEHVGKTLQHGEVSAEMPVWDHENNRWGSIRDRYSGSKGELKKVIKALLNTEWDELDRWDDRPLRQWLHQHTDDQGVVDLFEFITVLECMTDHWWDHSASDNLFVRKMHFAERGTAAYSCWPGQGWDGMWADLADAFTAAGGDLRLSTPVERVVIEDGVTKGVAIARQPRVLPNEFFEEEILEADHVICTLPVWHVLNVVDESDLPDWYAEQIKFLAQDKFRIAWIGLYLATEEPVHQYDPRELSTWLKTPNTELSGFMFNQTAMDPSCSPEGTQLHVMGGIFPGEKGRDRAWLRRQTEQFEADVAQMWPGFAKTVWRRRHLVFEPSFGVIQKPGLVGAYRPHWNPPRPEGLWFAGETFRSRGIGTDRAARAALTVVEEYLGRRLSTFGDGWRY